MIVYFFLTIGFLAIFMTCLTQLKYSIKKSYIIIVTFSIAIFILNVILYLFLGIDFVSKVFNLTVAVPTFTCFLLLSKLKGFKFLFSFITVFIFHMLVTNTRYLVSTFFPNQILRIIFETFFFVLIIIAIIKYFQKPYFKIQNTLDKGWGLLCSVPFLLASIIYLLEYYPSSMRIQLKILILLLIFLLLFFFYIIVYKNFGIMTEYNQLKQDKNMILIQTDIHKKEYEAMMDKINTVQIYRHDMRHHLNLIQSFLNDNNISEAQKYLRKLNDCLSNTIVQQYCDNYIVNVIFSSYISKAKLEHIDVKCKATISEYIKIDSIELVIIFTNAIENAIIACKKIMNHAERKISIVCEEYHDQIYIQICNTFAGIVLFDGEFPISNEKEHGIGTRSIAVIVEKYGGIFSFKTENSIFKTTVILNCR